ncbi:hypothetical protein GGR56DRAFT_33970 [Xylariaceae sp. FL0804]|nr:hypothetical protein GGR56DRAFT_33970 [Xylariaceae sp. FL0804]
MRMLVCAVLKLVRALFALGPTGSESESAGWLLRTQRGGGEGTEHVSMCICLVWYRILAQHDSRQQERGASGQGMDSMEEKHQRGSEWPRNNQ